MKIGLVRHFEVKRGYPKRIVNAEELMTWMEEYDESEVIPKPVDLGGIEWKHCYSSDLYRAKVTAKSIYDKEITFMEDLREVRFSPIFQKQLRLPLFIHLLLLRGAWYVNHTSQPETKTEIVTRINKTLDHLTETQENTLIIGHGGIMIFMRRELLKRGFKGPKFNRPKNAELYVFERI
ncbi:histidine phosphatase family protein [Evansella tamaricis]|uniref:Histidine phosphatase family protein n=1 Tax=Evansella tamaricis TaxID=2069301 RepID=A0ABS6JHQ8_9BACI|nr:histidine phosphatase family protein [Evansella tamaricis]MBU9713209.1 histidine phosphatase family protein [Evansella tamaricis]